VVSKRKADDATRAFDGKAAAAALPLAPGVYRMLNGAGDALYVGKARALRNRVGSYFNATPKPTRIMAMLAQVARIEVTVTRSEADALLLENQLIKSLQPRYNVMLRDDKSYPFVLLTRENGRGSPSIADRARPAAATSALTRARPRCARR